MLEMTDKVAKKKIEVEMQLSDQRSLVGALFVRAQQRLSDLLNDDRDFLPLQTTNGLIVNVAKSTIAQVVQLDQRMSEEHFNDPYEILGIKASASEGEIKKAYHKLCADSHPDRLVAMGLTGEFMDLANTRMVRINDAYQRILADRESSEREPVEEDVF